MLDCNATMDGRDRELVNRMRQEIGTTSFIPLLLFATFCHLSSSDLCVPSPFLSSFNLFSTSFSHFNITPLVPPNLYELHQLIISLTIYYQLHIVVANFQERMQLRRSLIELEDQNVQNGIEVCTYVRAFTASGR